MRAILAQAAPPAEPSLCVSPATGQADQKIDSQKRFFLRWMIGVSPAVGTLAEGGVLAQALRFALRVHHHRLVRRRAPEHQPVGEAAVGLRHRRVGVHLLADIGRRGRAGGGQQRLLAGAVWRRRWRAGQRRLRRQRRLGGLARRLLLRPRRAGARRAQRVSRAAWTAARGWSPGTRRARRGSGRRCARYRRRCRSRPAPAAAGRRPGGCGDGTMARSLSRRPARRQGGPARARAPAGARRPSSTSAPTPQTMAASARLNTYHDQPQAWAWMKSTT